MQYITVLDYVILPFVLALVYGIAIRYRNKHYRPRHPWRKYFIPGLSVKILGALFIGMVYQYYYGGGDTFQFYKHSLVINSAFEDSPWKWVNLIFRIPDVYDPAYFEYIRQMEWYMDPSSYAVAAIAAVFGGVTLNTYLPAAVLFAFVSFSGIWALFRTLATLYPKQVKQVAIAVLFIPSVAVWGSGMFKDTVCMFGLGWLTYCTFRVFVNRDVSFKNLFMLALSFYLIAVVKIYILLAFLPALGLWLMMNYSHKIKTVGLRWMANLLFIAVVAVGFIFFTGRFARELNKYSLDNIARTADVTRSWIHYSSGDDGSAYDLGTFDPSFTGMITKFPQAVVVTLYRPFLWEARKVIMFFSALEAFGFLILTIMVFYQKRGSVFKLTFKDPTLLFFLVFTLIFAFAVGISSYNFGSLSRYKIPCMPFFAAYLLILLNYQKDITPAKIHLPKFKRPVAQTENI